MSSHELCLGKDWSQTQSPPPCHLPHGIMKLGNAGWLCLSRCGAMYVLRRNPNELKICCLLWPLISATSSLVIQGKSFIAGYTIDTSHHIAAPVQGEGCTASGLVSELHALTLPGFRELRQVLNKSLSHFLEGSKGSWIRGATCETQITPWDVLAALPWKWRG